MPTREQMIKKFHEMYLANIAEETRKRGLIGGKGRGGIPVDSLTPVFDQTVADFGEWVKTQCLAGVIRVSTKETGGWSWCIENEVKK